MEWIDIKTRVPDDRRCVYSWGIRSVFGYRLTPAFGQFLGVTKFNPCCSGGQFDLERCGRYSTATVTHWAEITPPK